MDRFGRKSLLKGNEFQSLPSHFTAIDGITDLIRRTSDTKSLVDSSSL